MKKTITGIVSFSIILGFTVCEVIWGEQAVLELAGYTEKPSEQAPLPDPVLRYDCASDRFVLLEDYVTPEITVPAGEYTDGVSRPAFTELMGIRWYDRSLPACIVHDYMYREGLGTKKDADDLFAHNLLRCHDQFSFPIELIKPMVTAVRVGGKGSYAR